MAKKHLLITLGLLITSQANGMAAMRNFGTWAKTWYRPALFSGIVAWCTGYKTKPVLCEAQPITINSSAAPAITPRNRSNATPNHELNFKEFNEQRDTTFLLDCLQKDAHNFLLDNNINKHALYELLEDRNAIILYANDVPVGFCIYSGCKINYLGITQEHRGKGYATKLIQYITNLLKTDSKKIILMVRPENYGAIKLYETLGFKRKDGYGPNLDIFRLNTQPKSQEDRLTKYWLEKYAEILM